MYRALSCMIWHVRYSATKTKWQDYVGPFRMAGVCRAKNPRKTTSSTDRKNSGKTLKHKTRIISEPISTATNKPHRIQARVLQLAETIRCMFLYYYYSIRESQNHKVDTGSRMNTLESWGGCWNDFCGAETCMTSKSLVR